MKNFILFCFFIYQVFSQGCNNGECFIEPIIGQNIGDCSQASPCQTIEFAAEQVAQDNDTITLMPGIFTQTRQTNVPNGVTIRGMTSDISQYTLELLNTFSNRVFDLRGGNILFENFQIVGVTGAGGGGIFRCNQGPATFRNLLLRDGMGTRGSDRLFFFNTNAQFDIENLIVRNITLPRGGTSIISYRGQSTGTLSNIEVNGCSCGRPVFFENGGNRTIQDSLFINNIGSDTGSIRALDGGLDIFNTLFIRNTGNLAGAARLDTNLDHGPTITNCTFIENLCFGDGGALSTFVRNNNEVLTISDCLFESNTLTTVNDGGAINNGGNTVIENTIFRNHTIAPESIGGVQFNGRGGTIFSASRPLTLIDCIFEDGSVGEDGFGAAIYSNNVLDLQNVSFDSFFGRGTLGIEGGTSTWEDVSFINNMGTPDIALDAGTVQWQNTPPTFIDAIIISFGASFNPHSDLQIRSLAILEANFDIQDGAQVQIVESFIWTGGSIIPPVQADCNLTLLSTATGLIDTENHNLRCPFTNYGDLEIRASLSGNALSLTNEVTFTNEGTIALIGTETNEAIFDGGNQDFVNNGIFRAFRARIDRPLVCGPNSQIITQLRDINQTNALNMDSNNVIANGTIFVEREFPFWATPGEIYTVIHSITTLSGAFNEVQGLEANIVTDPNSVSIEITDTPFVLTDDFISTNEDEPASFIPFFNDFSSGGNLTFLGTSDDSQFTYDPLSSLLTYSPTENLAVGQNYTYTAQDQFGDILQGTITVEITPINDPPNELLPTVEIETEEVITNISLAGDDIDTENLQYVFTQLPNNGQIILLDGTVLTEDDLPITTTDSNLQYVAPADDTFSTETFEYNLFDGEFSSSSSEVSVSFDPGSSTQITALVAGVVVAIFGCFFIVAITVLLITCIVLKPRKPRAKTALEHMIARADLALVLSLIELNETDALAEHLTTFFLYHRANSTLLAYLIGDTIAQEDLVAMLFRENSFASKLLKTYMQTTGAPLLKKLHPVVDEIIRDKNMAIEVDANKLSKKADLTINQENLRNVCSKLFRAIRKAVIELPQEIREICEYLYRSVEEKWENRGFQAIGAALFLRWICPALVTPEKCGLTRQVVNGETRRKLILISKVLQVLANGSRFGQKEGFLEFMNDWIDEIRPTYITFITTITYTHTEKYHKVKEVAYKKAFLELHKLIINQSTELAEIPRMKGENIQELNKILIILGPPEDDLADEELKELEGKTSASSMISPKSNMSDEDRKNSIRGLSVEELLRGPPPEKSSDNNEEDHTQYSENENDYVQDNSMNNNLNNNNNNNNSSIYSTQEE